MYRILKVAWREYVATAKTKTFFLGMLMTPAIIALILYVAARAERHAADSQPPSRVALSDLSGQLSAEMERSFERYNSSHAHRQLLLQQVPTTPESAESVEQAQKDRLRRGELDIYVVLDADVVAGRGRMRLYTGQTKPGDFDALSGVRNPINEAVVNRRCKLRGVSPELLAELRRRVPHEHLVLGAAEEERVRKKSDFVAELMLPFAFMWVMFMGIFGIGQHMLTSIIEEKSSRVIELLLSALSPFQLMSGKVLGLAGIGLTIISVWGAAAYAAARWRGLVISVPAGILPYFIIYYILGFLLFSSILAGIGSVCNTIKEAQSLMMPVTLLCVVPMVSWFSLVKNPHGTLARALSFVPPLTPMVMIVRLSARAELSLLEVIGSMVVLAAFVPVVVWAGAKVFRTGILMFGKRPGLGEILRWIRQT